MGGYGSGIAAFAVRRDLIFGDGVGAMLKVIPGSTYTAGRVGGRAGAFDDERWEVDHISKGEDDIMSISASEKKKACHFA